MQQRQRISPTDWLMALHRNEQGTAMIEMALVLPVMLFFALLLTQVTLLMGGRLFVQYSAFAAARSAIVQIPIDTTALGASEAANVWSGVAGTYKYDRVQTAAAMALLPVAGRLASSDENAAAESIVQGMQTMYGDQSQTTPSWVTNGLLADRVRYALANTDVQVMTASGNLIDAATRIAPRQTIRVRVHHRLNLSVPYIRGLFATDRHTASTSTGGNGMYSDVNAQCQLTNEGISRDFPPRPTLDRRP